MYRYLWICWRLAYSHSPSAQRENSFFFLFLITIHKLDRIKVTDFVSHFSRFFSFIKIYSLFFSFFPYFSCVYFSGKCQNSTANWSNEIFMRVSTAPVRACVSAPCMCVLAIRCSHYVVYLLLLLLRSNWMQANRSLLFLRWIDASCQCQWAHTEFKVLYRNSPPQCVLNRLPMNWGAECLYSYASRWLVGPLYRTIYLK